MLTSIVRFQVRMMHTARTLIWRLWSGSSSGMAWLAKKGFSYWLVMHGSV
jgi:hypothetical protein